MPHHKSHQKSYPIEKKKEKEKWKRERAEKQR
jgi:hypothetical protein